MSRISTWQQRIGNALLLRCKVLVLAGTVGLTLPSLQALLPPSWQTLQWGVDLFVHWQLLYAAGLLIGALTCFSLTRKCCWLAAAALAGLPWVTAAPQAPVAQGAPEIVLSVGEANVYFGNKDPEKVLNWLSSADVDVAVLLEVSPSFADRLKHSSSHPYQHVIPRADSFGIAIVSRVPFDHKDIKVLDFGEEALQVQVTKNSCKVSLTAVHPVPPLMAPKYHGARDAGLQRLAQEAGDSNMPALVVGDLNATPWSSAFRRLSGLRRTTSLRPTWHSLFRGWMGIPIDHVLASSEWEIVEEYRGPYIASDHYPIVARLGLRNAVRSTRTCRQ